LDLVAWIVLLKQYSNMAMSQNWRPLATPSIGGDNVTLTVRGEINTGDTKMKVSLNVLIRANCEF
jgi:hypothetical protein